MASTPEQLGKYKIVRPVGKGAMGVVYEGFDTIIERTVAIKTIRTDELDPSEAEEHSRRFLIEAKAAGKLNHPNIVAIYDYGKEQNLAYIVMEYVHGKELKAYFDAGHHFDTGEILRIMSQLLGALEMAHANGVVHRDIKPANIFLTDKGSVKLGDFGIARIDSTHKTHAGTILGTPSYMSPEQIKGESVDQRSDLYSTGVILYQFLTGEKPFSGSMVAVMHKVLNEEPPPPSTLNPQSPPAMDLVIAKAMAKDQSQRYSDARQFIIALRSAVRTAEDAESEETRVINIKDLGLIQEPRPDNASRTGTKLRDATRRDATLAGNEVEIEFWRSIGDSEEIADFEVYLRKYPNGHYAELAQLKITKLRRAETTLTGKPDATSTLGQPGRIVEMRRKAEDARRRAEEEYLRAEEELKLAEESQRKEQEAATQKAETVVTEALEMQRTATALSRETDAAIHSGELVDAVKSIKPRVDSVLQTAGQIQSRLSDLLVARELLQAGSQEKAESALSMSVATQQTLHEALQRLESAVKQRVEASVRQAEAAIEAARTATLALRQTEPLSLQAIQAGTILASADKISQAIAKTSSLANEADNHIQAAYTERNWLPADVLARFQSASAANEQLIQKLEQIGLNFEEARRLAQEEAKRRAEEEARLQAEAARRAEDDAKLRAQEETRRLAQEEAKRRAEEEARLQAEAARRAEDDAKLRAQEETRLAQEEAKRRAEEEARLQAEAARRAEDDAKLRAQEVAKRRAEEATHLQAEADATLIAPVAMVGERGTKPASQPAKLERVAAQETLAASVEKPKNAMLVPAIVGGVIIVAAVGWLAFKPEGQHVAPAPTPGAALTSPEPSRPDTDTSTAQRQADQTKAASQDAELLRQQADQVAKSKSLDAKKALEDAKKLTDLKARETAMKAAKDDARQAEEARQAADAAQVKAKAAAKAEADAAAKAKAEAMAKARNEAEAAAKARSDAEAKASAEAANRASADAAAKAKAKSDAATKARNEAEAAAKARSDADAKASAEAASRASADAAAKAKARAEPPTVKTPVTPSALFQQAQVLEQSSMREAVKRYEEAGNAGYGPASKRLGEIYVAGAGNVGRDYVKSVKWYGRARDQGMDVGSAGK